MNCRGDDDIDAKRLRPSKGKTRECATRAKRRVKLVGTRSADHIRASGHSGRIQRPNGCTRRFAEMTDFSLAPRAPNHMIGDGETVTPLLPEPGVWTGMASANVWAPLRWKHAKIHRGSRQRILGPHQEAGYTSAVGTVAPDPITVLQSGGVHIRPHMADSVEKIPSPKVVAHLPKYDQHLRLTPVTSAYRFRSRYVESGGMMRAPRVRI
jgi:hypothetical protein